MSGRGGRAGFTLVELMIAMVLTGIVLGAMYKVLNDNQRYYRSQGEVTEVQHNLRAVALIMPAEFRELAASEGDIIAMGGTEIAVRAMRAYGVLCAAPIGAAIIVRNSLTYAFREVDPTRDSLFLYADGDPDITSDDQWLKFYPAAQTPAVCPDGAAATQYTLTGPTGSLPLVLDGAPVRSFERVRYSVYEDGGDYWLGVQTLVNGSYSALSPVAGPLTGSDGIEFTYYDEDGVATGDATDVASIGVIARGRSRNPINATGRPRGYYYDSVVVRTSLRNN